MNWADLKNDIAKVAPVLGTAIGGPAGAAVGALVSSALGTDNTPDAVLSAVQANPDAVLKLQELEKSHTEFLANLAAQNDGQQLQIDLAAEQSASLFQKWRDGLGWTCVTGVAYDFVVQPLGSAVLAVVAPSIHLPPLDSASLMGLLMTLLGAVGAHTYENVKDAYHV